VDGVNVYIVAKTAALSGIRVLLTGLGGDEIFGGYTTFARAPSLARHNWILPLISLLGRKTFATADSWTKWHKLGEFKKVGNVRDAYLLYRSICWNDLPISPVEDMPPEIFWLAPETMQESANAHEASDFLQVAFLESAFYMRNQLLRDGDIFGSANSIEIRFPYLHLPLIEMAWSLPGTQHIDWHGQKKILRTILQTYDPVLGRAKKRGFVLPWDRWLRTILKDYVIDVLTSNEAYLDLGLSPGWGRSLLQGFEARNPSVTWMRIWSLVVLLNWCRSRKARIPSLPRTAVTRN